MVFLGSVRNIERDPKFPGTTFVIYRFKVDAIYKGLTPGTSELMIDPGHTACEGEFKNNTKYIVFAYKMEGSNQYVSNECSGSRPADYFPEDLRFLDLYRLHRASSFVFGRVLQNAPFDPYSRPNAGVPLQGARVVLKSSEKQLVSTSDAHGAFRFDALKPGPHILSASRPPFVPEPASIQLNVPATGCVEAFPILEAHAELSGTVRQADGAPAGEIAIELARKEQGGGLAQVFRIYTDKRGRFNVEGVPAGDYLLGNEIWSGRPSNSTPYPTHYYPNSPDLQHAAIIHLVPFQQFHNANLTLPKRDRRRLIRVEVLWPDATSPHSHLLQLFNGRELLKNVGDPLPGERGKYYGRIIEIDAFTGRFYDLHAIYWIDDLTGPGPVNLRRIALSDHVKLQPGSGPTLVKLTLRTKELAGDMP